MTGVDLVPPPGWTRVAGALVILAAHVFLVPLVASFVIHGRGTHAPIDPPRRMITRGIYRNVRNPMYLLYMIVIAGEAIAYRSFLLLAYAGVFWLLAHLLVVGAEEKSLRRRFGDEYDAYCRKVPRWIPRRHEPGSF
jgi:protein-S-isoprenylcysteine O-methyltransferase Ste14